MTTDRKPRKTSRLAKLTPNLMDTLVEFCFAQAQINIEQMLMPTYILKRLTK